MAGSMPVPGPSTVDPERFRLVRALVNHGIQVLSTLDVRQGSDCINVNITLGHLPMDPKDLRDFSSVMHRHPQHSKVVGA